MPHDLKPHEKAHHVLALITGWAFILGGVAICCAWQFANEVFRPLGFSLPRVTENLLTLCDLHLGYAVVLLGMYWLLRERYAWRGYRSSAVAFAGLFGALVMVAFLVLAFASPWILDGAHGLQH